MSGKIEGSPVKKSAPPTPVELHLVEPREKLRNEFRGMMPVSLDILMERSTLRCANDIAIMFSRAALGLEAYTYT